MFKIICAVRGLLPRHLLALRDVPNLTPHTPHIHTHTSRMSTQNDEGGEWLWPLSRDAHIYAACDSLGTRKAVLALSMSTALPLQPSTFTQALTHLCRKVPVLQIVLRQRGGTLWYYKPATQAFDIKVLKDNRSMEEICSDVCMAPIEYTNPVFWRAQLVTREAVEPCTPDIKAAFPHNYLFIFYSHHALGDGLDAGLVCRCFVDILSDLLDGQEVDDIPVAVFHNAEEIEKIRRQVQEKVLADPDKIEALRRLLPPQGTKPLLLQIADKPQVSKPATKHVNRTIEQQVMTNFIQKAKAAGVSISSGLMAANNTALVEMAKSVGFNQDSYSVTVGVNVTLRHYLPKSPLHQMGPYTSHLTHSTSVHSNIKEYFWDYAVHLHKVVHSGIRSRMSLEQEAVKNMNQPKLSPEEYAAQIRPPLHDYGFSYLGDLSVGMPLHSTNFQIKGFHSYNLVHRFLWSNLHQVSTFGGITTYTISYDTQYLTEELMNRFIDQLMVVMRDVSDTTTAKL